MAIRANARIFGVATVSRPSAPVVSAPPVMHRPAADTGVGALPPACARTMAAASSSGIPCRRCARTARRCQRMRLPGMLMDLSSAAVCFSQLEICGFLPNKTQIVRTAGHGRPAKSMLHCTIRRLCSDFWLLKASASRSKGIADTATARRTRGADSRFGTAHACVAWERCDNQGMQGKRILLGVTGGIAAYKSPDLVRRPREGGGAVQGGLHAADLVPPLCLATQAPLAVAPAMNHIMWANPATRSNIALLSQRGVQLLGPGAGDQACRESGPGRMLEPLDLADRLAALLAPARGPLSGRRVLITAGPTRERIDPVRFISNRSSGKMGFAVAQAAREAGASVVLVAGPVSLPTPAGVTRIDVVRAAQLI